MSEQLNSTKLLAVVGAVLFSIMGWGFNKAIGRLEVVAADIADVRVAVAKLECK